jgi:hypothetical protein
MSEEEERYISMQDAAALLKVERPALHYYVRRLKLEKKKFELDKKTYIKMSDFERIRTLREEAAKRGEITKEVA